MKKVLIIFLLLFLNIGLSPDTYSKNYAILISGGYGPNKEKKVVDANSY